MMKRISNLEQLVNEKNLLELHKLRLEKDIRLQWKEICSSVREKPALVSSLAEIAKRGTVALLVSKIPAGWLKTIAKNILP